MKIQKLEDCFFKENSHLVEVLDKDRSGAWISSILKQRGYGVVLVELNGLRFGIPLRSHMNHHFGFKTKEGKGLDYTKAVLLIKDGYISEQPFLIPSDEFVQISDRERFITQQFEKYVKKYIEGVKRQDENILRPYKFSTLQNYHKELGL